MPAKFINVVRYVLVQDKSFFWYVIPADKREDWNTWTELPEDDERGWEAPDYAKEVGGGPSRVTFTHFGIED